MAKALTPPCTLNALPYNRRRSCHVMMTLAFLSKDWFMLAKVISFSFITFIAFCGQNSWAQDPMVSNAFNEAKFDNSVEKFRAIEEKVKEKGKSKNVIHQIFSCVRDVWESQRGGVPALIEGARIMQIARNHYHEKERMEKLLGTCQEVWQKVSSMPKEKYSEETLKVGLKTIRELYPNSNNVVLKMINGGGMRCQTKGMDFWAGFFVGLGVGVESGTCETLLGRQYSFIKFNGQASYHTYGAKFEMRKRCFQQLDESKTQFIDEHHGKYHSNNKKSYALLAGFKEREEGKDDETRTNFDGLGIGIRYDDSTYGGGIGRKLNPLKEDKWDYLYEILLLHEKP